MFPGSAAATSQNARSVIRFSFRIALKNEAKFECDVFILAVLLCFEYNKICARITKSATKKLNFLNFRPMSVPYTLNTFITSSPRWLMTLTAMRPVLGGSKGREVSLWRGRPGFVVDFGFEGGFEGFVGVVGT